MEIEEACQNERATISLSDSLSSQLKKNKKSSKYLP
jgi:hypothetical protein